MEELKKQIYQLISQEFNIDLSEVTDNIGPGDLTRWDSIGQLRLIVGIEQTFKVQLTIDDVMSMNSVKDIIEIIKKYWQKEETVTKEKKPRIFSGHQTIRVPGYTHWGKGSISAFKSFNFNRLALIIGSSEYANSIVEEVKSLLPESIELKVIKKISGEPTQDSIENISRQLLEFSPDSIAAIGGGSTIDAAKLAWALYEQPDFKLSTVDSAIVDLGLRKKASFVAVPTTFGSGSEASSAAAFTKENKLNKTIVISHNFIPDQVILDPSLGKAASLTLIYSTAFDALTHAIEGYVSIIDNPFIEPMAIWAIKNILSVLSQLPNKGLNLEILEKLCYSSYYAGIVQNHCSVGLTHSLSHQLGGFAIAHGVANAMFLTSVIEHNSKKTDKYNNLIRKVGFESVSELVDEIKKIFENAPILPQAGEIEVISSNKDIVVNGAMKDITFRTNPVLLTKEEVEGVFDYAVGNLTKLTCITR